MLSIAVSPQLHRAVKLTKASVLLDSTFVSHTLSSMVSPSESMALVRALEKNSKKDQGPLNGSWL